MVSVDHAIAYGGLIVLAMVPIYMGSYCGLRRAPQDADLLEPSDAWKFPLIGSSVLFGLYLLFSFFSKEYLNYLFTAYFSLAGLWALSATLELYVPALKPQSHSNNNNNNNKEAAGNWRLWKWTIPKKSLVSLLLSLPVIVWYCWSKHWVANNLLGLVFCIQAIAQISLSFTTGCMILWGLFIYDIFWVFGTPVMVTVATNLDGPIKLLFPKNLFDVLGSDSPFQFALLGLGDIVLPGIFIALLLRFDAHMAKVDLSKPISDGRHTPSFPKTYFKAGLLSYFVGLFVTMAVMQIFKAAQPALLYLVPACTLTPMLLSFFRKEWASLYAFSEDELIIEAKKKLEASSSNSSSSPSSSSPSPSSSSTSTSPSTTTSSSATEGKSTPTEDPSSADQKH